MTKALTKPCSLVLPVLTFSQEPNCCIRPSRFRISPTTVPSVKLMTIISVPVLLRLPSTNVSIFSNAPPKPTNRTQTPMACISVFCRRGWISFPPAKPSKPPSTMAPALMIVPRPIIACLQSMVQQYFSFNLAMYSGVVPQQPPIRRAPAWINVCMELAKCSASIE